MHPCVSCVPVDLYVLSLRCYRLVLRPVKALLARNFRCTVTEYVLARCSIRKPRAKSVYASRARVHTEQDDLSPGQPVYNVGHTGSQPNSVLTLFLCESEGHQSRLQNSPRTNTFQSSPLNFDPNREPCDAPFIHALTLSTLFVLTLSLRSPHYLSVCRSSVLCGSLALKEESANKGSNNMQYESSFSFRAI